MPNASFDLTPLLDVIFICLFIVIIGYTKVSAMAKQEAGEAAAYEIEIEYQAGAKEGVGNWLQLAVNDEFIFDDFLNKDMIPSLKKEEGEEGHGPRYGHHERPGDQGEGVSVLF